MQKASRPRTRPRTPSRGKAWNAEGSGGCGIGVCRAGDGGIPAIAHRSAGQPARARRLAQQPRRTGGSRLEPASVRRDRISLVHRGGARSHRPARGPVLRDDILRERPLVPRHAVHACGFHRRDPGGFSGSASHGARLDRVSVRAGGGLQPGQYLHDQDGRHVHAGHVDTRLAHRAGAALDGRHRHRLGAPHASGELLPYLELLRVPALGGSDQWLGPERCAPRQNGSSGIDTLVSSLHTHRQFARRDQAIYHRLPRHGDDASQAQPPPIL